ncbi:TadE/TadG family type IV pilus assembly protein [Sphingobium sp. EM0848]|uniref:TadE/TadG family type IV pilus assembly protein n=1 Tax=Sphingobium sp. EM0848 TaxID=2743473 RepID=UPI002101272A|nr:TadE/TadG family type IV pilus assembly protein [Sphingobium sp. EM0848]
MGQPVALPEMGVQGKQGQMRTMGDRIKRALFILMRLYHNQTGNTLAIVAAAVIPLAGLIGGGVDMSRAYMVRARMQQACDAAALAGRRAMTTSSMTDANKTEAKRFFDFNFPQGTFGASSFTPTIQSKPGETTTVQVGATATIPTTVMRIFGKETMELAVNCESRFDIGNTDVMLVLDTTGSMTSSISDGNGGSTTRMAALQKAVKDFYDTLGAGSDQTGRIRYGFMPYTSTVNVGYQLPASYLLGGTSGETWNYQTRANLSISYNTSNSPGSWVYYSGSTTNGSGSVGPASSCPSIPSNTTSTVTGAPTTTTSTDANGVITTTTVATRTTSGTSYTAGNCSGGKNNKTQNYTSVTYSNYIERKTDTSTQTPQYSWQYGPYPLDVSGFVTGNAVANPTYDSRAPNDSNGNSVPSTATWKGCIEERATDSTITSTTSASSIPGTAYDLQVDTIPNSTATKWRPHWPEVEFTRGGSYLNTSSRQSGGWNACPSQARKLTSYPDRTTTPTGQSSSFNSYVDGLVAIGGTYHDIGMVWGARFLSPTGIFGSENSTAPNGFNISRHIVFMTDGDMSAYTDVYGAWGYQTLDQRDGPSGSSDSSLTAIHNRRLEMLCNSIKGMNITIWIIGFRNASEGAVSSQLQNCATSSNHWMMAYDGATLSQKFKDIAKNIGGLRLSN